jgi:alpha-L-arabinofuranosidase
MEEPVKARVVIQGFGGIQTQGQLVELVATKDAVNDLQQPDRVAPRTTPMAVGQSFDLTIPAMSVQVVTLQTSAK